MSVRDISCLSNVVFKMGPLTGFSRSLGAQLVVVTQFLGTESGSIWVAKNADDEGRLVEFASYLAGLVHQSRAPEME